MLDVESILRLYANVLHNDIVVNSVPQNEIRKSVQSMAHVYSAEYSTFENTVLKFLNYNDTACRCAYLHKYAPLHTYIAFDAMLKVLKKEMTIFRNLVTDNRVLRLCSLGGGPGSDIIGVISALKVVFGTLRASISIVDCMEKWKSTFQSIIQELKFGGYGPDWYCFANELEWNYIGANLLCKMSNEVNTAIGSASFITMMKFISASVCTNTEEMVDKIFRVMKVGALVLYIDNAGGGFTELILRSSKRNGLMPVVGPLRHVQYDAEALKIERFGYTSCYQTRVTIILLQKVLNLNQEIHSHPTLTLQNEQKRRQKLDFVVYKYSWNDVNNQSPLNVNVFSPELDNTPCADSKCLDKCPEKMMNNLKTSPANSSNAAWTVQNFPGTSVATRPPKSNSTFSRPTNHVSTRNPNPAFSQKTKRVAPRISQPVSRPTAVPQRYLPVSPSENNTPRQEPVDDADDFSCCCCVIS